MWTRRHTGQTWTFPRVSDGGESLCFVDVASVWVRASDIAHGDWGLQEETALFSLNRMLLIDTNCRVLITMHAYIVFLCVRKIFFFFFFFFAFSPSKWPDLTVNLVVLFVDGILQVFSVCLACHYPSTPPPPPPLPSFSLSLSHPPSPPPLFYTHIKMAM